MGGPVRTAEGRTAGGEQFLVAGAVGRDGDGEDGVGQVVTVGDDGGRFHRAAGAGGGGDSAVAGISATDRVVVAQPDSWPVGTDREMEPGKVGEPDSCDSGACPRVGPVAGDSEGGGDHAGEAGAGGVCGGVAVGGKVAVFAPGLHRPTELEQEAGHALTASVCHAAPTASATRPEKDSARSPSPARAVGSMPA